MAGYITEIGEQDKVRIYIQWTWNTMSRSDLDNLQTELNSAYSVPTIFRYGGTSEKYFVDKLTIQTLKGNVGYKVVLEAHSQGVYSRGTV